LHGVPAGFENTLLYGSWSKDDGGERVAEGGTEGWCASATWKVGRFLYKLPGHKGTVTSIDFHPKEPIILSGSKDGIMLLEEIEADLG